MSKNESIVDRVVQRIKEQPLGDLIKEEDLHDVVKEAIHRVFLETRRVPNPNKRAYHDPEFVDIPPLIHETLKEVLEPTVRKIVEEWFANHQEVLLGEWRSLLEAGVVKFVEDWRRRQVDGSVRDVLAPAFGRVNEDLAKRGLPPLFI